MNNSVHKFMEIHKGKRVFILGNAPSILEHDLVRLKDEYVIGMNASTLLEKEYGFFQHYYVVSDMRFLKHEHKKELATSSLSRGTERFLRNALRDADVKEYIDRTHYIPSIGRDGFSKRLDLGYYFGCTTTMLALQVAYYMGFGDVYLLGCDLRYPTDNPRFYSEDKPQVHDSFTGVQIKNIVTAAEAYELENRSVYISNKESFLAPYLPYKRFL